VTLEDYFGLYIAMEDTKRDKSRVDISRLQPNVDITGVQGDTGRLVWGMRGVAGRSCGTQQRWRGMQWLTVMRPMILHSAPD
jgi:hypothetical protein